MHSDLATAEMILTSNETTNDSPCWYAIYTKSKEEDRADRNLRAWGVETFAPKIRERRYNQYTKVSTFLTKPLFPRYIFARFKAQHLQHKVSFTRGVQRVVNFGGDPVVIDEQIISIIRTRLDDDGYIVIGDEFAVGDSVLIKDGPLAGFNGIFKRGLKDKDRVVILLTTASYQPHVVIEREFIKKEPAYAVS